MFKKVSDHLRIVQIRDGSYQTKNIEDLQAGDWVWSRDQSSEGDDASLHQVARVFKKVSDHLRVVQIRDADGNVETIQTTDEHPFWVAGRGWTAARDLAAGDQLNEADDSDDATVVSSVREEHPEGVAVYNFEVAGDHTYFVEDGLGLQTAVWVHNRCNPLNQNMKEAGSYGKPGEQAAHLVPHADVPAKGLSPASLNAIQDAKGILARHEISLDAHWNGFRAKAGHLGTHEDAFFIELGNRLVTADRDGRTGVLRELQRLKYDVLNGKFNKWRR